MRCRVVQLVVVLIGRAYHTMQMSRPQAEMFRDRTNDPFFKVVAAEREGLLATAGSYHLVQLYTRRPVLIDGGGLDGLVYAPEGAPMAERILRDVYGLDYFNPPPGARSQGLIPHDLTRAAWESYSPDKWRDIPAHVSGDASADAGRLDAETTYRRSGPPVPAVSDAQVGVWLPASGFWLRHNPRCIPPLLLKPNVS